MHHVDVRYKIIIDVTRWKHEVGCSIIKKSMIILLIWVIALLNN